MDRDIKPLTSLTPLTGPLAAVTATGTLIASAAVVSGSGTVRADRTLAGTVGGIIALEGHDGPDVRLGGLAADIVVAGKR